MTTLGTIHCLALVAKIKLSILLKITSAQRTKKAYYPRLNMQGKNEAAR